MVKLSKSFDHMPEQSSRIYLEIQNYTELSSGCMESNKKITRCTERWENKAKTDPKNDKTWG